jgi:hypothetical protein
MGTSTASILVLSLFIVLAMLLPTASRAQESNELDLARELGAVLAWRLGPGVVENRCRKFDSDGSTARALALKTWQDKNATLISAVDTRVAEVVAVVYPKLQIEDAVRQVSSQVEEILLDALLADKKADEIKTLCAAEADARRPRWTSNGMPHVQESLAALYDWLVQNRAAPRKQAGS